jgi:hypothetical protein
MCVQASIPHSSATKKEYDDAIRPAAFDGIRQFQARDDMLKTSTFTTSFTFRGLDGGMPTSPTKPQPDSVLVKALVWRWQKPLDQGVFSLVTEIAAAERILKSYVSRILRLSRLAPDLVEVILGGWADQRLMLERLERPLPPNWQHQRALLDAAQW